MGEIADRGVDRGVGVGNLPSAMLDLRLQQRLFSDLPMTFMDNT
jgi:hypothetical protein